MPAAKEFVKGGHQIVVEAALGRGERDFDGFRLALGEFADVTPPGAANEWAEGIEALNVPNESNPDGIGNFGFP
jgi:hypothetical protein